MEDSLRLPEVAYHRPINPAERLTPGWWAMVLIIVTEAVLFAYLLMTYLYLAAGSRTAWPPHGPPELTLVVPNTIVLLSSSVTIWWGERGIRIGDTRRLQRGLLGTILLGVVFLSIQGIEYSKQHFTPRTDAYGSVFFTITGLHGAHVFAGLLFVGVTLLRTRAGHFSARRHLGVSNASMYWHFVDAVWLTVFTVLYLSPHFAS